MMLEIFADASCVRMWMGTDNAAMRHGCEALANLPTIIKEHVSLLSIDSVGSPATADLSRTVVEDFHKTVDALDLFFGATYWKRVWIRQGVCANKLNTTHCGINHWHLPSWRELFKAIEDLPPAMSLTSRAARNQKDNTGGIIRFHAAASIALLMWQMEPPETDSKSLDAEMIKSLENVMAHSFTQVASEPLDYVYAQR
jgi:hypothetical protein